MKMASKISALLVVLVAAWLIPGHLGSGDNSTNVANDLETGLDWFGGGDTEDGSGRDDDDVSGEDFDDENNSTLWDQCYKTLLHLLQNLLTIFVGLAISRCLSTTQHPINRARG